MSRLAQSAASHGDYVVQQQHLSHWVDVECLTVLSEQHPIDAFGEWLEEQDAEGSYRLIEILDEEMQWASRPSAGRGTGAE